MVFWSASAAAWARRPSVRRWHSAVLCGLPKAAQAQAGPALRSRRGGLEYGLEIQDKSEKSLKGLPAACLPLVN
ncbi:hypothetical protein [Leisingera sp. ANG59]|uniref:hypothetical protein n=1 Tax=Leisingera sp. ANG59 TaxID=2675221 RepID=UPI0015735E4D|nr:hypothetical protein [Leisingera sp. ANG59]NSY39082.1 hypothetical protein [Leisingera sp. ANG59]